MKTKNLLTKLLEYSIVLLLGFVLALFYKGNIHINDIPKITTIDSTNLKQQEIQKQIIDSLRKIDYSKQKNQIKNENIQIINQIYNTPDSGQFKIQLFLLSESERLDSLGYE